jgi:hypothetical protein
VLPLDNVLVSAPWPDIGHQAFIAVVTPWREDCRHEADTKGADLAADDCHIVIVVAGLGRIANDNWHTDVYVRRSGHWKLVWSQATPVGGLPAPTHP